MNPLETIEIEFDGGTSCNIPSRGYGRGYGSYRLDRGPITRVTFGNMSANAAEISTLLAAIERIRANMPQVRRLRISGDSKIALKWARPQRKTASAKTSLSFQIVTARLQELCANYQIETHWRGRAESVRVFRH